MIRFLVCLVGLLFTFILAANVVEVDQPAAAPTRTELAKEEVAKRQKTGIVVNLTETKIKIEFKNKGKVDTMEFSLLKPAKVQVGEKVTVFYTEKDGQKEAFRVTAKKASAKKSSKSKTTSKK